MSTIITPNDGALPSFTLARDPDRGERVGLNLNNRQLVTAGGVLDVLVKGPASQSFPLSYRGLNRKEYEALDAYIVDTLVGGVKTFRIQHGTHENLLTRTVNLGDDPPWQKLGATNDPVTTYPSSVLAPDYSATALQVDYTDWTTTGANQKILNYARLPEGNAVTAVDGDVVELGLWARTTTADSPLNNFQRLKIQTDSEDSSPFTINLTDAWQFFTVSHTFSSGGGANLAFEVGNLATATADHTVYYWHPSLVLNGDSISSGRYQTVPETDYGHIDVKFGSPALSWKETIDDGFDVTLNLFKMGSG